MSEQGQHDSLDWPTGMVRRVSDKEIVARLESELSSIRAEVERLKQELKNCGGRNCMGYVVEGYRNWVSQERFDEVKTAARELLDWQPVCSVGSSGYLRQEKLRAALSEARKET